MVNTKKNNTRTPIKSPTTETKDIKTEATNSINEIATQALINPKNIFFIKYYLSINQSSAKTSLTEGEYPVIILRAFTIAN